VKKGEETPIEEVVKDAEEPEMEKGLHVAKEPKAEELHAKVAVETTDDVEADD
jgi:hypothetical protein